MKLSNKSKLKIETLIDKGWEFLLHYGEHRTESGIEVSWEANFTRKLSDGKWDNHKSGYDLNVNLAISKAYFNILHEIKLR